MADNRLKLKNSAKLTVRKDLFGAHNDETTSCESEEPIQSPLDAIWGESESTQPFTNSILLSPALKRAPKRFSTSSSPKSPGTAKKKNSTPKKLSKYSPFRKRVHNPNPKDSIKNFFTVTEKSPMQYETKQSERNSLGIIRLNDAGPSNTSAIAFEFPDGSQENEETENTPTISEAILPVSITVNVNPNAVLPLNELNKTPQKLSTTYGDTPSKSNSSTPKSLEKKLSPTSKITGKNDFYREFLLRIIQDVWLCSLDPELFSEEEYSHMKTFSLFDQPSQRLYARLLNRKLNWIRTCDMKYGDIDLQLMLLEQQGFITSNCSGESLDNLLNLLKMPELKTLCKSYKLPESGVKSDLISRLISRSKQPSIASFFIKGSKSNIFGSENNLRTKIYQTLGKVIKVESGPQTTFSRCLLFFSYPHFHGLERDRFSDQLALVSQFNKVSFPLCDVQRTKVFQSRDHFLKYELALLESSQLSEAKETKNWDTALQISRQIVKKLKNLLANNEVLSEVEAMPDYLRRFTEGYCYVRAVSGSIEVFKKYQETMREAEESLEMLLGQRLFSRHRRGQWYEQLALLYQHNLKDNIKACHTVLRGLRDEYIDIVSRHTLCARAAMLEGRKTNGLKDYLKDTLVKQRSLVQSLDVPEAVTISKQVLASCRTGLKQVYVQNSEDGQMLCSVEEVAKDHFKQEGYCYGFHDEGSVVRSVIFACFWDEIYGDSVSDGLSLFHSEYQTSPLDWNSESFYQRRREKFRKKLQDLAEGGEDCILNCCLECRTTNVNKESVVNWKYFEHFEVIESFVRSLDIDVFLNIARLLLKECKIYSAGFPDLTLWNPREKKMLFVEVKSPNDQLSMKQRVWLHNLNKMRANAVVCHVQSVGYKSKKRKASPTKDQSQNIND